VTDLAAWRLHTQRLVGTPCSSPAEVVRLLTAVQSQDYAGATWAIAQRTAGATEAEIEALFDSGVILRTHILRPTWHFVPAEDIRWLLDLSGPRIRTAVSSRHRQLEIDGNTVARANAVFEVALSGGRSLTRKELGEALRRDGIAPDGQRLPHLLASAEHEGLVVSGPRRGKQQTYALLEERVPATRSLDREEALAEMARRYFRGHGPAQVQDAMWWCWLPARDIRTGIALAGHALTHRVIDGKEYWFDAATEPTPPVTDVVHLLPNWDEYTVGYRDRSAAMDPNVPFDPALFSFGSILSNVVTIEGRVRGSWRRTLAAKEVRIDLRLLAPLAPAEAESVERAADRLGRFLGKTVELTGV
jgi:winged helix DNA-binding protein